LSGLAGVAAASPPFAGAVVEGLGAGVSVPVSPVLAGAAAAALSASDAGA